MLAPQEDNLNQIISKSDAVEALAKMPSVVILSPNPLALISLVPHILLLSKTQKVKHVQVKHVLMTNVVRKIQNPPVMGTI